MTDITSTLSSLRGLCELFCFMFRLRMTVYSLLCCYDALQFSIKDCCGGKHGVEMVREVKGEEK